MLKHSTMVRKKSIDWNRAGDLYRRTPMRANVRSGSNSELPARRIDVSFTPLLN
jgi:hypothetical protein